MKNLKKIVIAIAVIALLVFGFFTIKSINGNIVRENSQKHIWLQNNCECLAYDNKKCPEEFSWSKKYNHCIKLVNKCGILDSNNLVYSKKDCKKIVQYSPPVFGCSEYECAEGIYKIK